MLPSRRPLLARLAICAALCAAIGVAIAQAASAPGTGPGPGGAPGGAPGAPGGNGPGAGASGTGGGNGGFRPPPGPGLDAPGLATISRQAETEIAACGDDSRRCVADALDAYAVALRRLAPRLAPRLRILPDIVARAASRVRRAHTAREAIVAVSNALAEVHKTIALLRADDPITLKSDTRAGLLVAETLEAAGVGLERAAGL